MNQGTVLVTGGAGFIGSHVAEFYAAKGFQVKAMDNLSRDTLLGREIKNKEFNWNYLKGMQGIELFRKDVRQLEEVKELAKEADIIIHTAAQTAVTASVQNPAEDFSSNALGTFNVLEAARLSEKSPAIVYCSTNKVYGENVNNVGVKELEKRYAFESDYSNGIPEGFGIDLCEHTPYGCSKLAGDIYAQDYGHLYGLKVGVFRMSCIYGTRQFGLEDQGWISWLIIAALTGKKFTIYGDGKQVRDVLYVKDLVQAYNGFVESKKKVEVFNTGGGKENTLSLLELIELVEKETGKKIEYGFGDWRPSDQKVYVSDISKINKELGWKPETKPEAGVKKLIEWVSENREVF